VRKAGNQRGITEWATRAREVDRLGLKSIKDIADHYHLDEKSVRDGLKRGRTLNRREDEESAVDAILETASENRRAKKVAAVKSHNKRHGVRPLRS
jgi:hypothetical protein